MRCKICKETFRIPPPSMKVDQICSMCRSKININYNQQQEKNYSITKKIEHLEQKTYPEDDRNPTSTEIPQANNLERLIYLIDFISKNIINPEELAKRLGIDPRQVLYYTQAAQMLDLIEQYRRDSNNFYKITSYGENLLTKKWPDRFIVLRNQIKKIPLYEQLLESLESKGFLEKQEVTNFFFINTELSESTAHRRASTFFNWIHMTKLGTKEEDKIFSNKGYRSFSSEKDKQIKSINNENAKELPTKNIPEKNPSLTFNKYRGKLLELIKNDESQYFFMEMENRIVRMSKRQITKLFNEI